jgi:hypothetical protein
MLVTEPQGRRAAGGAGDDRGLDRRLCAADTVAGVLGEEATTVLVRLRAELDGTGEAATDDDPPTFTPTDTWPRAPAKR